MNTFEGTVLDSVPEELPEDQRITPFVTDVSPDNVISMEFSETLNTSEEELSRDEQVAVRQSQNNGKKGRSLSEDQLAMYDGDNVGVYDVFSTISIQLDSTISDELEPVTVEWTIVNFDGESA